MAVPDIIALVVWFIGSWIGLIMFNIGCSKNPDEVPMGKRIGLSIGMVFGLGWLVVMHDLAVWIGSWFKKK